MSDDIYEDIASSYFDGPKNNATAARAGVLVAADTNPDYEAELKAVAQRTGVPIDTVRNHPEEMNRQDKLASIDFDQLAIQSPATTGVLANVDKAKIAHDDIDNLSAIEQTLKYGKNAASAVATWPFTIGEGIAGAAENIVDIHNAYMDHGVSKAIGTPIADMIHAVRQNQTDWREYLTPKADGTIESGIYSGLQSIGPSLASIAMGNPTMALGAMSVMTGGQSAAKAKDKGIDPLRAGIYGAADGVVEGVTEKFGVGQFFKDLKAGSPIIKTLINQIVPEVAGEEAATVLQDFNEWSVLHQDKPLQSYLDERPGAAAQTLIATLVGSGGMVTIAKTAQAISNIGVNAAEKADNHALNLEKLNQLAAASKVLKRSPEVMKSFIDAAIEDSPVQNLYIDAKTFAQSGVAEHISAALPGVAAQLQDALATGGEIRIPVSDYVASIAGTEHAQALTDHLRVEGEDFTRAEAQTYMQTHAEELQKQVERTFSDQQEKDSLVASHAAVKATVLEQLNTLNRFSATKNELDAALISARMAVRGAQLGITPEQMYDKQKLNFAAEDVSAQVFGQVLPDAMPDGMEQGDGNKLAAMYRKEDETKSVLLSQADPRLIEDAAKENAYLGTFSHSVDQSALNHIRKNHSDETDETARGQLPVTDSDIAKISDIIKNYDGVRFDLLSSYGKPAIAYIKQFNDGILLYMEEAHNKRHDLAALSMRKYPATADALKILQNASPNVRSDDGHEHSIGKPPKAVNTNDANSLNQDQLGSFNPATNTIAIFKKGDLSTVLHELGHFFFESDIALAAELMTKPELTPGEQSIVNDVSALLSWHGIQGTANEQINQWYSMDFEQKRGFHERTAEAFEAYLFTGQAPSIELQHAFQTFRTWLTHVYKSLKAFLANHPEAGKINDDVRNIFDRMLASEDKIKLAEKARSMMPLFESAEKAGMTEADFAGYQALGADATNAAIEALQTKGLRDMQWMQNAREKSLKNMQKQHDELRREVRAKARIDVMSQPVYQAYSFLTGKLTDEATSPDSMSAGRFDLAALQEMDLPDAVVNLLVNLKMTARGGLNPDLVSDLFGFSSGDELVNTLASAENPKAAIERLTDDRMMQDHAELATPEAIEHAADVAVHNDVRARFVTTEANALAKATGSLRLLGTAAKDYAEAMIARLKVRDIQPMQYSRAEIKAARAAAHASKHGDIEQAAIEKRNQVLNLHAARAAYAAKDEIDKILRYFKRFDGTNKKIDVEYIDQISGLLEKFDLRNQSGKQIDEQSRLRTWVQSRLADGELPNVAETLLNPEERAAYMAQVESRDEQGELVYSDDEDVLKLLADAIDRSAKRSYKDATYEELQGLYATIKQMEHLGRLKNKLLTAQDERSADAIYNEIAESIDFHGGAGGKNPRTPNDVLGKALARVKDFGAAHIKVATWARIMDGGKDNGPVWRYLVKPSNARATQETTMKAAATQELDAIMRPILKKASLADKSFKGKYFPSIGTSLNWQERFAILLNMGNESNLQRLMGGGIANVAERLSMQQILDVVGTLSWEEVYAAQRIWDHFESYRPLIAEKEKRVSGVEPNWIPARAIDIKVKDGRVITLRGGYFPVKFDPRVNRMAEAHDKSQEGKDIMKASYSAAVTRRTFIKNRVEEVTGRPLLLNMTGLYSGINDVIHDLAWHEWVIDANKILKKIDAPMREFYGPEVNNQFSTWRNDIIVGQRRLDHGIEKAAAYMRQYVSASALTFNIMSAAMQPLGLTNSIARIGMKWVGKGVGIYIANPIQATKAAQAKSEWLRNRPRTRFRELNELRNQVQGQTAGKELMGRYGYWLMVRLQMMVDISTWHGGYEKAIAQGFDEDTAIALADQGVKDSQGGGEEVDQSGIERGSALTKLFTAFYGFMGTTLNVAYGSTKTESSKAKIAANLLLTLSVPAVLGSLLKDALTPGGDDDDELIEKLIREQLSFLIGLIVVGREFSTMAKEGMGYSGPTGLRIIPDTLKLAAQAGQGEFDTAFRKQFVNVLGDLTGIPAVQVNRTWTGIEALNDGETKNPAAIAFGFRK